MYQLSTWIFFGYEVTSFCIEIFVFMLYTSTNSSFTGRRLYQSKHVEFYVQIIFGYEVTFSPRSDLLSTVAASTIFHAISNNTVAMQLAMLIQVQCSILQERIMEKCKESQYRKISCRNFRNEG